MELQVNIKKLNEISTSMQNVSKDILCVVADIRTIAEELKELGSNMNIVAGYTTGIVKSANHQMNMVNKMSQALRAISQQYATSEKKIVDKVPEKFEVITDESAHALPKREDLPKIIQDYLDNIDWTNSIILDTTVLSLQMLFPGVPVFVLWTIISQYIKERQANLNFQDLHQEYVRQVENMYDNASGRAKEVYDKYKKDVKIEEILDPVNPKEEKAVSHYTRGTNTLYINTDDMDDRRGPASVYYHEYGHYVVDRMGWIKDDRTLAPEFKRYQDALQNDIQEYIDQIENRKRIEYQNMGYSEGVLERLVGVGTVQELRQILGGKNTDVLDGVSDMIDAQTNSKYQITYRHPIRENGQTYWEVDPTRQANEAFAEMFSADFCSDDQAEIEFIKYNFPNAYREYQNLLESAVK